MKKAKKAIIIVLVAAMMLSALLFAVACDDKKTPPAPPTFTLTFDCDGATPIEPITATAGSNITPPDDPQKAGHLFRGWYETSDHSGNPVEIPTVMPQENKTYYAYFVKAYTLTYDINLENAQHEEIAADVVEVGEKVTVKDGNAYKVSGYMFLGWSTEKDGLVYPVGAKNEKQYNAGEVITPDADMTLYAQWAKEYDAGNGEKVFVYSALIGKGKGAAIYVNAQDEIKYGFVAETENGYNQIEFYGFKVGRLYDDGIFLFCDGLTGSYARFNYATQKYEPNFLALDGYGNATYSSIVGNQTRVDLFGKYTYDAKYGDYTFIGIDTQTGEESGFYFTLVESELEGVEGEFIVQGGESGSYLLYFNGELYYDRLDLNGYGVAKRYSYDVESDSFVLVAEGAYKGTENFVNYLGEWEMSGEQAMRFVLQLVSDPNGDIPVYIQLDETHKGDLTAENGDTLYLDGYGNALYTQSGGTEFVGICSYKNTLVTFVPYIEDESGVHTGGKLFFNVDWENRTFTVNDTGYITDGNVLVSYEGDSSVIVIPDGITEIAADVFKHKDIVSVTIPESVKTIGIRAFENQYTLTRAIFLSQTPITIDWSKANCPFRWPSNSFIIVVPEECVDIYKAAWSDCPYTIKGSEEVKILPEFEVIDGVLVRYNKPKDASDAYSITIPAEVTEIADYVFRGFTFITGVDLCNVTKVGDGAFSNCVNLQTVTTSKLQQIGAGAFEYCVSLGGVTDGTLKLPCIVSIGANAFQGCEKLKLVRLGETIANIDEKAFCECHIYEKEDELVIELLGEKPPVMGEKVFVGNIGVRIKVLNIDVALACFAEPTFNSYCRHLYIESGSEKGLYIDGGDTLEIDGRVVLMKSWIFLYSINEHTITFYEYDSETATYATFTGRYVDETITFVINNEMRTFVKAGETITYTSTDNLYTLVCRPADIDPETYIDTGTGYANVTFNGVETQMKLEGLSTIKIKNFLDSDQKRYDFTITLLPGNKFSYEKETAETYVRDITANDGSVINLHYLGQSVYVFGTLKIEVADGVIMPDFSDYGTLATFTSANEFTFTRLYKNTEYLITVTLSEDKTTFTYTFSIQE